MKYFLIVPTIMLLGAGDSALELFNMFQETHADYISQYREFDLTTHRDFPGFEVFQNPEGMSSFLNFSSRAGITIVSTVGVAKLV